MSDKDKLIKRWMESASDVIEHTDSTAQAVVCGGPGETVKLCLFASLVPNKNHEHYMNNMTALHDSLTKNYAKLESTRPTKPN